MKPKGVTTQMKVLDEYILMVLFVLPMRVHFHTFLFDVHIAAKERIWRKSWLVQIPVYANRFIDS